MPQQCESDCDVISPQFTELLTTQTTGLLFSYDYSFGLVRVPHVFFCFFSVLVRFSSIQNVWFVRFENTEICSTPIIIIIIMYFAQSQQ